MKTILATLLILTALQTVHAGECVMTDSYAKCNGAKSCDVVVTAASAQACAALSLESCKNARFDITQYKSVKAMFDHQAIDKHKDFCNQDAGDYRVAANFPFRNKADCK